MTVWNEIKPDASKGRLAFTHLLFELTAVINAVSMSVYWGMIHSRLYAAQLAAGEILKLTHTITLHCFPTVSLILIYWVTERLVIKSTHWKMLVPFVTFFTATNYFETMERGTPVYWFLTWEDSTTLVVIGVTSLILVAIWFLLAFVTYSCKGPIPQDGDKKKVDQIQKSK